VQLLAEPVETLLKPSEQQDGWISAALMKIDFGWSLDVGR